jgi:hypothetical protein
MEMLYLIITIDLLNALAGPIYIHVCSLDPNSMTCATKPNPNSDCYESVDYAYYMGSVPDIALMGDVLTAKELHSHSSVPCPIVRGK